MAGQTLHDVRADAFNYVWDNSIAPEVEVDSGDDVELHVRDAGDEQITPDSGTDAVVALDFSHVNPVSGPVFVKGARPGDTLAVEILELRVKEWGWTAIIPGFGLLPDDFLSPYLRIFDLTNGEYAFLRQDVAIPIRPFFGTMGVCPSGASNQPVMPPGTFGGNLD